MNRRTRGAATVGLIWVVVLIVLLLAAVGAAWLVSADKTKAEERVAAVTKEREAAETKYADVKKKLAEFSKAAGFRDPNDPDAMVRIEQMNAGIEDVRNKQKLGADATTASKVIELLGTRVDELTRQLAESEARASQAEQARAALQGNLQDVTKQKDEANDKVTKQLSDERDRHANQEATDKGRIDDLDKRLHDAEARQKADKDESDKTIAKLNEELKVREGRITELAKKVEMIKLPDSPDGSVVDVSTANTCYIDLGRKQLLRRGTRFKVFNYTKNGAIHEKGMIEVTSVEDSMAEATVVDLKDRLDPLSKGDKIAAPNYDPAMPREFVLTGRFPSGYSKAMVTDRLRSLGATVKDAVGPATDFLVVGDKEEGAKPEEAAGGEAGAAPSEDEQIKRAQLYRVQIIQARDILEYLKYE